MKELSPREAYAVLQTDADALLIDVRSEIEHLFVGHPPEALSIPWSDAPDWEINPDFVAAVERVTQGRRDRPLLLLCRSGNRSACAAATLLDAGFTRVINIRHGFEGDLDDNNHRNTLNGWRVDGLPWVQS
jgi:rhodanese-related sulfurtransferase